MERAGIARMGGGWLSSPDQVGKNERVKWLVAVGTVVKHEKRIFDSSVANRFAKPSPFFIITVAEKLEPVLTRGGLSVNPHHQLADCPTPDLLIVPGGQGTCQEMHKPALIDWIKQASTKAELVMSVCTGALLLAKAGLLDGLEATTHHGAIDLLRQNAPKTTIHADRRFVDNGRVICSAGIAAGIDMSLHVVARLLGREIAEKTARQMEYPWRPEE
jgi:transcriptional regulator GlxA family with amidase domain